MPSITAMMSVTLRELALMACMVSTTLPTMAPPRSATPDADAASPLAVRARSVFCFTMAVSSLMLDAVSSSVAACSSVRWDRSVLPAAIWCDADEIESLDALMRVTRSVSMSSISPSPPSRRPKSPPRSVSNSLLRSPAATVSAMNSASLSGISMARVRRNQHTTLASSTAPPRPQIQVRVLSPVRGTAWAVAAGLSGTAAARCSSSPIRSSASVIMTATNSTTTPNAAPSRVRILKLSQAMMPSAPRNAPLFRCCVPGLSMG
ncbi:hypothetical protein D3C87_1448560 [compost metagenome]